MGTWTEQEENESMLSWPQSPVWDYESESYKSTASIPVEQNCIYLRNRKIPQEKTGL